MRPRALLPLALLAVGAACAPRAAARPPATPATIERPAGRLQDDDDLDRALGLLAALAPGDPARAPLRGDVVGYLARQVEVALRRPDRERAFSRFELLLSVHDPAELRGPADADVARAARAIAAAFGTRGGDREVLTALEVLRVAPPGGGSSAEIDRIAAWVDETYVALQGRDSSLARLVEIYEAVAQVWPSPAVVERLADLYRRRYDALARPAARMPSADLATMLSAHEALLRHGYHLARLFLRVDDLPRAARAMAALAGRAGDDERLRPLVERAAAAGATAADWVRLGRAFSPEPGPDGERPPGEDRAIGLRLCRAAARRFPADAGARRCAAEIAVARYTDEAREGEEEFEAKARQGMLPLAVRLHEEALAVTPGEPELWERLAALYQERLGDRVTGEDLGGARAEVGRIEGLAAQAARRWPTGKGPEISLAQSYALLAQGLYNDGQIGAALVEYRKAVALKPLPPALRQIGVIHLKRGETREAVAAFERAADLKKASAVEQKLWTARMRRLIGDAYDQAGDAGRARSVWRAALRDWDQLLGLNLLPEWVAEAQVDRGRDLYALGEVEEALRAFEAAVDAKPDNAGTYIDVIAFLVPRGHLAEALDAYHRAVGRDDREVSEYFKVYVTLWIRDLLRRAGEPADPIADDYLASLAGSGRWYNELARWAVGGASFDAVLARADTKGKKAELFFYEAMNRLAAGKADEARGLWKQVVGTDMMGFFEYEMAQYYLRHGATAKPATPRPRPSARVPPDAI